MRPDHLEGFGPSNRTPGSSREEKTYVSPRSPIRRHGLARCEVVVSGGKGLWSVYSRNGNRLIATIARYQGMYSYRFPNGTPEMGFRTRNSALEHLLQLV